MLCLFAIVLLAGYAQPYTLDVTVAALSESSRVELDPPRGVYDEPTLVTLTTIPGVMGSGQPEVLSSWAGAHSFSNSTALPPECYHLRFVFQFFCYP